MSSAAISRVEGKKVTTENPPREDVDGLDFERCAALHNAIIEHGWTRSGRAPEKLPRTTWWDKQQENSYRDAATSHLHPSVVEFLKLAYQFEESNFNFFHYLIGLRGVGPDDAMSFKENPNDQDADHRYYTLYSIDQTHAYNPDGLIYDQVTHTCLLNLNTDVDCTDETLPWQKLESVLTVYIELIENGKVVAFHKDLEFPDDWAFYDAPDSTLSGFRPASQRPNAMIVDPFTGYPKKKSCVEPWMVVPNTDIDLSESLRLWNELVEAIHGRIGGDTKLAEPEYGLAPAELLDQMPDGFAKQFFASALKPRFKYIAPGLRVQTIDELLDQPYASYFGREQSDDTPPILILRGEGSATPTVPLGSLPHISIPAGLYLEPCCKSDAAPWEDGVALILPYTVGGHGSWARTADQQPLPERNDSLYQIGRNPFVAPHPTPLAAVLFNWCRNLMLGNWTVNADGVADGIGKYHEADTREHCMEYVVEIGPGLPV